MYQIPDRPDHEAGVCADRAIIRAAITYGFVETMGIAACLCSYCEFRTLRSRFQLAWPVTPGQLVSIRRTCLALFFLKFMSRCASSFARRSRVSRGRSWIGRRAASLIAQLGEKMFHEATVALRAAKFCATKKRLSSYRRPWPNSNGIKENAHLWPRLVAEARWDLGHAYGSGLGDGCDGPHCGSRDCEESEGRAGEWVSGRDDKTLWTGLRHEYQPGQRCSPVRGNVSQ